ncbi:MAG: reductase [Actinomycetota bacterium]|nr:reductase [Actinomycetota bacterium]
MRMLVLGGTVFLSRAIAAAAVQRGHEVVCAARGIGGSVPEGVRHLRVDRADPAGLEPLADQRWDAVIDVARRPSWVRAAVAALGHRAGHWTFVSSGSVYADHATPELTADAAARLQPPPADADETALELYGELKVACEDIALENLGERLLIVRPGLVVGPGDPSGRFAYWPAHVAAADEVLAPGRPDDSVQMIDVRDLAAWHVRLAEDRVTGVLDGLAPATTRAAMLEAVCDGVGRRPPLTWVGQDFLLAHDVQPWMGERSIPLWLPLPEYAGFMARDVSASLAAGLAVRPLADTARDTGQWLRSAPDAPVTGLTLVEEADLLQCWHRDARM